MPARTTRVPVITLALLSSLSLLAACGGGGGGSGGSGGGGGNSATTTSGGHRPTGQKNRHPQAHRAPGPGAIAAEGNGYEREKQEQGDPDRTRPWGTRRVGAAKQG